MPDRWRDGTTLTSRPSMTKTVVLTILAAMALLVCSLSSGDEDGASFAPCERVRSVTVLGANATQCKAVLTVLFVMGLMRASIIISIIS